MRFAVILVPSSGAEASPITAERSAALRDRLMRAGFNAMSGTASAERGLAPGLDPPDDGRDGDGTLVVYIAGELRLEPATLRFGASEIAVDALGAIVRARRTASALLVLDVHHAGEADDAMNAAEHVDAALHALGAREQGLEVLI